MNTRGNRVVLIVGFLVLFVLPRADAQPIYAQRGDSAIVMIDPTTGAESSVASGPAGLFGISTFDVAGRRLFYLTPSGGAVALVSVDVGTATVAQVPLSGPSYTFVEFDPVNSTIYAQRGDSAIVMVDPTTGAESSVASGPAGLFGISTLDVAGRRIFYLTPSGGGAALVSVNVSTGTVMQIPLSGPSYTFIEFDPVKSRIYSQRGDSAIVMFDSMTGAESSVASGPAGLFGISTLDVAGRRVFYLTPSGGAAALVLVNVSTDTVMQIPLSAPSYTFIEFAAAAAGIPVMPPISMIALVLTLAVVATLRLRL